MVWSYGSYSLCDRFTPLTVIRMGEGLKRIDRVTLALLLASLLIMLFLTVPVIADPGPGPSVDITILDPVNLISVGDKDAFLATMVNTGDPDPPQDVLQYITLTAVASNNLVDIMGIANVTIHRSDDTVKWAGAVMGTTETITYAPWSLTESFSAVTWTLPEVVVLVGGETLKIGVGLRCLGEGFTRLHIFPRATEDHHTTGQPLGSISDRRNLYQHADDLWYPLHNSYDPYDADIDNGHSWDQHTWNPRETMHAYAKGEKTVEQTEDHPPVGGFRITTPMDTFMHMIPWISIALIAMALIAISAKARREQ